MLQYDAIKNIELRELAMLSESINSLPENEAQAMIDSLNSLSEEGQEEMIKDLKEEQNAIQQAKDEKGMNPEEEMTEIESKTAQIKQVNHDFNATVRREEEGHEQEKAKEEAETMLEELN